MFEDMIEELQNALEDDRVNNSCALYITSAIGNLTQAAKHVPSGFGSEEDETEEDEDNDD